MSRVPLEGGYYQGRSLIGQTIRCVNLYPESNQAYAFSYTDVQSSPRVPFINLPTPGLIALATPPTAGAARGLFVDSSGSLYAVVGNVVYYIDPTWTYTSLGTIGSAGTPVSFTENGLSVLLVDGSPNGWQIDIPTRVMTAVTDTNFYGATRVDTIDAYVVGCIPNTRTFWSSNNNALTFDSLYQANKSGYPDLLIAIAVLDREIWLIGAATTEIWFDAPVTDATTGAVDFPFQIVQGPFIQYGCIAPYSVARQGESLFWLGQDLYGARLVIQTKGQAANRISTHAIEYAIAQYSTVSDAIGFCYQQEGHPFFCLSFPTADKTWCFDTATQLWHERVWTDTSGGEHRHRAACAAYAYGTTVVADWETGALYQWSLDCYTDAGNPIVRRRGFAHMIDAGERQIFNSFIADVEVGESPATTDGPPSTAPQIFLRWSDDRGRSWSYPVGQSLGSTGKYLTSVQWRRCGMARDRCFELITSEPVKTAIQGAFVTSTKALT